jgi:hypothetical protein
MGLFGVCAVLAVNLSISSRAFEAAQVGASTQMAVVRGKIRFNGTAPAPTRLNMAPDPACAQFVNTSENVRVSDQGLENVMVYVSSPLTTSTPVASAVTLDQRGCRFDPHVLTLQVGQTLFIRNSDSTLQNVHMFSQANAPYNIGQPAPMTSSHTFDQPEAQIPIRDDVHRWKTAFVGVFSHPYHTVSKMGGLYELQLPPGSYEITVWHEQYGKFQQTVSVGAGETRPLDFVYSAP